MSTAAIIPQERIQSRIIVLRGQRVLLDSDLAEIYGIPVGQLNQAVKRNRTKFPEDFMFELSRDEALKARGIESQSTDVKRDGDLKSQNVISSRGHGGRRTLPFAFTEHGAIQAANILRSEAAVAMSVQVVRAFVRLRELVVNHKAISSKLAELDARIGEHDEQLRSASPALRRAPRRRAPSLRYGAARRARDHLRASRSVAAIIEAIRQLAEPVLPENRRRIGFKPSSD